MYKDIDTEKWGQVIFSITVIVLCIVIFISAIDQIPRYEDKGDYEEITATCINVEQQRRNGGLFGSPYQLRFSTFDNGLTTTIDETLSGNKIMPNTTYTITIKHSYKEFLGIKKEVDTSIAAIKDILEEKGE